MLTDLFSALFSIEDGTTESVTPKYGHGVQEDDIDLQLRALIYCYQRLKVKEMSPFYPVDSTTEDGETLGDGSVALDKVYNLEQFIAMLQEDPHHILVDWCKNKARLMCILSSTPVRTVNKLPKGFSYLILEPDSSEDLYFQRLVYDSKLYHEHDVPLSWKIQCLREIIKKQYTLVPTRRKSFNKQDRWQIMIRYLSKLAEHVQIERVYKAYRSQPPATRRLSNSSDGSEQSMLTRGLKSKPSMTILRLDRSVTSRSTTHTSALSRNQPNSPLILSRSPSPKKSSNYNAFTNTHNSTNNDSLLYQQSRNCVIKRLEREKQRRESESEQALISTSL
ncbi:uncharacterized protein KLLA0_A03311g [Kluyveromyces lactis]|uniref:KLLA0A03311p n=1 Tax=Kluyveromyces lactis (strain ATCC 8585 / CBS 2359 / DSM 70799 / NBRC 1267 / NRRL Y-1140 / WM37) TaxID=284590 RepID=Q6CY44_KLULA|nr:uncharacterized protein KLLA0_A03311g [Kluyveromyces lactis]CAH02733.1 KLLA0A03311p [Kluyveromyces lactis]|eukprot:XP_451145.1 uncharacterized protein KLLA0_A03311g [Kluyveromyces lactis]